MTKKFNQGFTLIELLVVIAIIGILSSVVLASLNTARNKGSDAAIKSNLANIRAQAEIIYDGQSCYGDGAGACVAFAEATCSNATADSLFANSVVWGQIQAAATASGAAANAVCSAEAAGSAWGVAVALKTAGQSWCVDSTGASRQVAAAPAAALAASVCQ